MPSLHAVCSKTGSPAKSYIKHIIRKTSINRHAYLLYCNCDMYIGTALYILQLRYVYRHRTLYIATAICISAPHFIYCDCDMYISAQHFIYCDCDMYICTALYILRLRYAHFLMQWQVQVQDLSLQVQDLSLLWGDQCWLTRLDRCVTFGLAAPRRTFEPHNEKAWLLVPRGCVLVLCRYI